MYPQTVRVRLLKDLSLFAASLFTFRIGEAVEEVSEGINTKRLIVGLIIAAVVSAGIAAVTIYFVTKK